MGLRAFFHKIKMGFVRIFEKSIPEVSEAKRYGNYGEDEFTYMLKGALPSCKIKRNVVVCTADGNAEIDCLLLYEGKLFAIEVKRWKGQLIEVEDGFLQKKRDRLTGEIHEKLLKSPFRQLGRAVYLLKKQVPTRAWINTAVFFEDDGLESVSASSGGVWFDKYHRLIEYIRGEGEPSRGDEAAEFFARCTPADYLYAKDWGRSLPCIIDRETLKFVFKGKLIPCEHIDSIVITHYWSYDELYIRLIGGKERRVRLENAKIQVTDNGRNLTYALCKLDYIELGRAIG